MKKNYAFLAAFLLPLLSLLIVYQMMGFYPFGEKSLYISDLFAQYRGFIMYAKQVFLGNESLQYSWDFFGGSNMMGNFAYYMGSLYNLLFLFIPDSYFYFGIVLVIALKFASISTAMYYFLIHTFKNKPEIALLLALNYTFSGMLVGYFFNIIWLDAFIFLPLIIGEIHFFLGNYVLRKRFVVLVFLLLLANFYIAYMVALFSVLYFFAEGSRRKIRLAKLGKLLLRLSGYALLALLMAAVIILPTLFYLTEGIRNTIHITESKFSFTKLLAKLFNGIYYQRSFVNTSKSVYPHIYSGILTLVITPLFFSKQISRRERLIYGVLYLFLIISFCVPIVGNIWHAFVYPTGFPYRFAFLFSFLSIYLTARALEQGVWRVKPVTFSCLIWSLVLGFLLVIQEINFTSGFWNQVLLTLLVLIALFTEGEKWRTFIGLLFVALTFAEVTVHQLTTVKKMDQVTPFTLYDQTITQAETEFIAYREKWQPLKKVVSNYMTFDTDNLYYHFPSVSGFSSMNNKQYLLMLTELGYSTSAVRAKRGGGTAITDILLGNQYQVIKNDQTSEVSANYQPIAFADQSTLFQTVYENPTGLFFDDAQVTAEVPRNLQQRIITSLGGDPAEYIRYEKVSHKLTAGVKIEANEVNQIADAASFSFDVPKGTKEELLYVYFPHQLANNLRYVTHLESRQVEPGWHQIDPESNEFVLVWEENQVVRDFSLYFMMINQEKLTTLMQQQTNDGVRIDTIDQTSFTGEIHVGERTNLVLPIPYEAGWSFKINGEAYPYQAAFGGLIQLANLPADSTLTITGNFNAPGYTVGLIISLFATSIFLIIVFLDWWKRQNRN